MILNPALAMLQIRPVTGLEDVQRAQRLIEEMARWDADESRRLGLDADAVIDFFYPGKNDEALTHECAPPDGSLLLATFADAPVGCGAFRRLDANTCELLHVYVRPQYRGRRIARRIVEELIETAAASYETMRLETATFMTEAQKLYASMGFTRRDPYREVPPAFTPFTLCMELPLATPEKTQSSARRA